MTVGLLIVSHSVKIAEGVVELAAQMAPSVALVAAGGTDDGGIGTSFDAVQAGLLEAESGDGVVVLCDLGSAVLTTETALDFADDPERIRIADAPIVEGAVAAAVAAESGADLAAVVAAAEDQGTVAAAPDALARGAEDASASAAQERASTEIVLQNQHGLHARPAAELVRTASGFDASVTVNGVDATSMLRVLALGLDAGSIARFEATGREATAAIAAIEALAAGDFGDAPG
ncbi:dihydroxyacetone kinase phosphoryl donor subunit DhaM [Agrococcus sp. Marseille-P2731]|uniref:dihydroxyacetone kinase phosphoryl donor subunit DhaM n=1 Tax=Agrococcus sp. Marseille-P2731 TaxID=1841862 RepID=UPI00093143DA|nr:dihydroxyacetone kinase phosphoryl donor subunit DhaM [Agrococcus sp. Marseille-P2731]